MKVFTTLTCKNCLYLRVRGGVAKCIKGYLKDEQGNDLIFKIWTPNGQVIDSMAWRVAGDCADYEEMRAPQEDKHRADQQRALS